MKKVTAIDSARTGKDLFNSDPLKHLLPALEKLAALTPAQRERATLPDWFMNQLSATWREYRNWLDFTNPVHWFRSNGSIRPGAIHNYGVMLETAPFAAWQDMKEKLLNDSETRAKLVNFWHVDLDRAAEIIREAVENTDGFVETFLKLDEELPF